LFIDYAYRGSIFVAAEGSSYFLKLDFLSSDLEIRLIFLFLKFWWDL